jgi:hypothetical protein
MRDGTEKYDEAAQGGYSYADKLKAVAAGMMDPQEIGLPPDQAGQKAAIDEIDDKEPTKEKFGDFVQFEASVVPQELRAHWARQDTGLVMDKLAAKDWEEKWVKEHEGEFAIQGRFQSGTIAAQFGQLFRDPVLGFAEMLRKLADLVTEKYEELKKADPNPIVTRYDTERKSSDTEQQSPKE